MGKKNGLRGEIQTQKCKEGEEEVMVGGRRCDVAGTAYKLTHTLSLFALIRVHEEAFALQSVTDGALPPGSIHRSRMERDEEEILTGLGGNAFR